MSANKETENDYQQQEAQPQKSKRRLDGNLLMSFAAIFLSAGTLFILIYQSNLISKQFELQQQQQFASAMPYLMLGVAEDDGRNFKVFLWNQGLGPAFIEAVRVHYKDTVLENSDLEEAYSFLEKMDKNISTYTYYSNIFPGRLMSSQETIEHIQFTRPEDIKYDLITNGDAQLEIEYRSIYNERWRIRGLNGLPERIK